MDEVIRLILGAQVGLRSPQVRRSTKEHGSLGNFDRDHGRSVPVWVPLREDARKVFFSKACLILSAEVVIVYPEVIRWIFARVSNDLSWTGREDYFQQRFQQK